MPRRLRVKEKTDSPVIKLALNTIGIGKQALVFVNTKRSAEKTAEEIAKNIPTNEKKHILLADKLLKVLSRPTKQCERLARCVRKGIAFHHAGLAPGQRELIEDSFRGNAIQIISCTPTLACGIDLPSFRTILKDLKRFGPRGLYWIPVLEYLQMAGRSGRPKYDRYGEAIAIAQSPVERDDIFERYLLGEPEEIISKLAVEPVLRTYILSLIATGFVRDIPSLLSFFEQTFWANQYKDMAKLESKIIQMVKLLEEWQFITTSAKDDFVSADELGSEKLSATPLGKRVAELYLDPYTAYRLILGLDRAGKLKSLKPISFLQLISNTLEMRPLLRVRGKDYELIDEAIMQNQDVLLEPEPSLYEPEHEEYVNSVKTALFMRDWADEADEETLLENYSIRPGEVRVKLDIADWLLYSCAELARLRNERNLVKEATKLRIRVNYGVKEELLPLIKLKNIGRVRARKMYNSRIRDLADVKRADLSTLSHLIGKNVALSVKEQLGQEIKEVKQRERKGQINLNDY